MHRNLPLVLAALFFTEAVLAAARERRGDVRGRGPEVRKVLALQRDDGQRHLLWRAACGHERGFERRLHRRGASGPRPPSSEEACSG